MFYYRIGSIAVIIFAVAIAGSSAGSSRVKLEYDVNTLLKIDFDNYRFEGKDASGELISPQKKGNPRFVPGYQGGALQFVRSDLLIYNISGNFDSNQGTIECFLKLLPVETRSRGYMMVLYLDDANRILLRFDGTRNVTIACVSGGKWASAGGRASSITEGQWYHFAFTWETRDNVSFVRIYVDGQLLIAKKLGIKIPDVSRGKLYIGSWLSGDMPLDGAIDEIRVSNIVRYDKVFYPDLLSSPAITSYAKKIKAFENEIAALKNQQVASKLYNEICRISKEYSMLTGLRKDGKYAEFLKGYKLFKQQLKLLDTKIRYARWWGIKKTNFEIIPYTCMEKINGIWKEKYEKNKFKKLETYSAGHEWQSFQILLAMNPILEKAQIHISATDLQSKMGSVIPKKNIHIYKVGVITPVLDGERKRWADPIYTVKDNLQQPDSFLVQPIWVNVYVPAGVPKGKYKGQIIFSANGETRAVEIAIDKFAFALPVRPRMETAFGFSGVWMGQYYNLPDGNSPRFKKLLFAYLKNMLEHKVSPKVLIREKQWNDGDTWFLAPKVIKTKDGKWVMDFSDYEKQLDELLPLGLNTIMVGNRGWVSGSAIPINKRKISFPFPYYDEASGTIKNREFTLLSDEMKKYARWMLSSWYGFLKKKGLASMTYTYLTDEPQKGYEYIEEVAKFVHSVEPTLRNMITTEPRSECPNIDLPCPLISYLNKQTLNASKGNFWTYVCCSPLSPHCNFLMTMSAIQNRIPFWVAYKFGAKGFLYYEHARSLWTNWGEVKDNPRWANMPGTEGDGFLVYPGRDGPINTIRFEYVRLGIQDIEYFLMLKDIIKKLSTNSSLRQQAEKLLVIDDSLIKSSSAYNNDWSKYKVHKYNIALMIEKVIRIKGKE